MKYILYSLFTFIFLNGIQAADDSWMVFDDSQVALIHVSMDSSALNWMFREENVYNDSLHMAFVHFQNKWIDQDIDSVAIRLRGNTSRVSGKKSFKLSFNTFIQGREFYDLDKMNINGEHNDPSVIRSKLSWDLFQKVGLTASRAFYAALYINDAYFGLYTVVEHIDDEFLDKRYADDSGNLWKCLWPADLVFLDSDPDAYKYFNEQAQRYPYELKTNEIQNDYYQLARFIDIINNTSGDAVRDSLQKILHVEEILKYMAMNVLTGSWDDYWFNKNNYYMYHEPEADRFHLIPYDYDNTFGISWSGTDWTDVNPYYFAEHEGQQGSRPLTETILSISAYRNLYTHFLEYFMDHIFNLDIMEDRIDSLKTLIQPWISDDSFYSNSYGFTMDDFNNSYSETGYYFDPHVRRGLKEYIKLRVESLDAQINYVESPPAIYHPFWSGSNPSPEDTIDVNISVFDPDDLNTVGVILVEGDQETPFILYPNPDNSHWFIEGADRWSGFIPPAGEGFEGGFYFLAQDKKGYTTRYPLSGLIPLETGTASGHGLVINEFLADNVSSNADQDNQFDDWLELYNSGNEPILISGKFLTDDPANLDKWKIPGENLSLQPGELLLIWCDEDEQDGYHTNFKLSKSGEFIAVTASNGITVLDSLSFGIQNTDTSFGRSPDGSETWMNMTPTPGTTNITATAISGDIKSPEKFDLKIYPNPFNSTAIIEFNLTTLSGVRINIYNTLGQNIRTLNTGSLVKGINRLPVSMNAEPSGMYFIHLEAGKNKIVKKILLLR